MTDFSPTVNVLIGLALAAVCAAGALVGGGLGWVLSLPAIAAVAFLWFGVLGLAAERRG